MPEISHPIPPLNVNASQATEQVQRWYKEEHGRKRSTPPPSKYIKQASDEHAVSIFNVGPWGHTQCMGSLGTYYIPAYNPDADEKKLGYALMPTKIAGVFVEYYPQNNNTMRPIIDDGDYVAEQILGIGIMHSPRNSLVRYGVGFEIGPKPSEKAVSAARDKLLEYAIELFEETEAAAAQGPRELQSMKTERHTWAARYLGREDVAWMVSNNTQRRLRCDLCGTYSEPGVIMCPNHPTTPWIFDQERFDKFMKKTKAN